jgi:uncharacterized protein (DUF885 family)
MKSNFKLFTIFVLVSAFCLTALGCSALSGEAEAAPTENQEAFDVAAPSVDEILISLEGLPIDIFFEESFNQLSLRTPEGLTHAGVSATLGLRDDQLNDNSDAYLKETQKLESGILDLLRTYDRQALTPERAISYDVYRWYLENQVRGHEFMYHNYPLTHFIGSYHFELDNLLTEAHPLKTRENAEDYIARLSKVNKQVDQLMEGLAIREEKGIIPPKFIIEMTRSELYGYLGLRSPDTSAVRAETLGVYTRFAEEIEYIPGLTEQEIATFREAARGAIEMSFIPGFIKILEYQDHLLPLATEEAGAWKLPQGDDYYVYMLQSETSTELSPQEIHELGLAEVERIHAEMRTVFADLGYSEEASLSVNFQHAVEGAGYYNVDSSSGQEAYIQAVEALIEDIDQRVGEVFDLRPEGQVVVLGGPMGGYYVPGTSDGSRPGSYHVSTSGGWRPKYSAQTIAYHEAVPGHHYQIALAHELDLPAFRNFIHFNGYVEGWALYAERLAWELGMYGDNAYGDIGRLQFELLRAVRLVTDTGLHAMGWTRAEAKAYMDEAMNAQPGWFSHEVDRYVVLPAQATGYKVGMIKILELRQRAMDELGADFDIKEFHNVVIGNGSLPLDILEDLVLDYIETKK